MTLDPAQIALVRETFDMLRPEMEESSEEFYEILFQIAPDLRVMFRDDMSGQGMRFMTALGVLVDRLSNPESFRDEVRSLGRGHAAYGVRPEHFTLMKEALVQTLRNRLGDRMTPRAETAWRVAFEIVAEDMARPE